MVYSKLASAIRNDVVSGLQGYHSNPSMSLEQLEDDIVDMRLFLIQEYKQKGILPWKDLMFSINCIKVDCKDLDRCNICGKDSTDIETTPVAHFEIPQLVTDLGVDPIDFIGSTDRQIRFNYYTTNRWRTYQKYRKRAKCKPYVYIDTTPNENGMYDGFIFNAPLIKYISVVGIFKDPRQLSQYQCCNTDNDIDNMSFLNTEIKQRLTQQKITYYRSAAKMPRPNDQRYDEG